MSIEVELADGIAARRIAGRITRHAALAVRTELGTLRRAVTMAPPDAYVSGMSTHRLQRAAIGEPDGQDAFPDKGR